MAKPNKYALYELSVQSPEPHIEWFVSTYKELRGKYARHFREDFCGTFQLSAQWVKRNKRNTALGLDLDSEPLGYGMKKHRARMNADQKRRLRLLKQNVLSVTTPKSDIIAACNFSFYVFKDRETLLEYFRCCHKSLNKDGIVVLEMAGGPGMVAKMRERKTVTGPGKKKFLYFWDQRSFNPINHDAFYAIHFQFPDGSWMKNAFTYDWRLWSIPEVRDALAEAGFKKSYVYWETEHKGKSTGEYIRTEKGDNDYTWIAQIVGVKRANT